MDRRWLVSLLALALLSGCGVPAEGPAPQDPPSERGQAEPNPEPGPEPDNARESAPEDVEVRLLMERVRFSDGSEDWICTYSYDENGRCVLEQTDDGNAWQTETINTYDDWGNLIGVAFWDGGQADGYLYSQEWHTYDEQNWLISSHCVFDDICWRDTTYQYDRQGRKTLMERREYEADRPGFEQSTVAYTYDEAGRLLREDESGERIVETQDEDLTENPENDAWARWTEYTYEQDLLVEIRDSGGYRVTYAYDENGNRVEGRTYGPEGLLSVATYTFGPIPQN